MRQCLLTRPSSRDPNSWILTDDALVLFRHRRQAFVQKLLHALAAVSFRREDVSFGIGGDAVHGVKLTRLPAAVPNKPPPP